MRIIRLLPFAGVRDLLGSPEIEFPLDTSCSAEELFTRLCKQYPHLSPYRSSIRLAINGTYALPQDQVVGGDEVALIPPVSGG